MQDTNSFLSHIEFLRTEIDKALQKLPIDESPEYLYRPIKYIVKGKGKRLRPILVHLSGHIHNADPSELMKGSLAIELLHNFSLVHDDIMDGDDTRHSQPSVHKKWDESTAILSGDALFALSQLLLTDLDPTVHQRFNEVALTVCEGQGFDKEFENNSSIKMDQYLLMISKKTGALLGLSSEIGGMIGGLNDKENNHLFQFGLNLGLAFQVQDDYLEIFSDESIMGKSLGSDIHYQKQTAMSILAREKDLSSWNHFIKEKKDVKEFRKYFHSSGIESETKKLIKFYIDKAQQNLSFISGKKRKNLILYSELILNREF